MARAMIAWRSRVSAAAVVAGVACSGGGAGGGNDSAASSTTSNASGSMETATSNSNDSNSSGGTTGSGGTTSGTGAVGASGTSGTGGSASGGASVGGTGGESMADDREEVWVEAANLQSCDDICENEGHECAAVCGDDDDTAADALYTFSSNINVNEQRTFDVCDQPIDQSLVLDGNEYLLVTLRCCCLAMPVERIMGDPENRISCDELCSENGLMCYPETSWGSLGTSALRSTYTTIDGTRTILGECDDVPEATVNRIGNDEPLAEYECGCVP